MKNNRFRQTTQTRHKRHKRQTRHKRRIQYGGKSYEYVDYSGILKQDTPEKKVVIPGYAEISDMIKEYKDVEKIQQKLDTGIKTKDVMVYDSCQLPNTTTPPTTIILLRKKGNVFGLFNNSIDCNDDDDKTYLTLASHNFQIFIKDILQWNPFLNVPNPAKYPKFEEPQSQSQGMPHRYASEKFSYQFTQESWWNSQQWWNAYKLTLPTYANVVAPSGIETPRTPIASQIAPPPPKQPIIEQLQQLQQLKEQVRMLTEENFQLRQRIEELTTALPDESGLRRRTIVNP